MDVPAFTRVAGNPTKQAGLNSIGLERKDFSKDEISNLKKAYKIFFREGLKVTDALEKIKTECIQNDSINIFIQSIENSTRGVLR
jgi:UDP-N-acetylglucosamine acyltransferase